jgi:replicative DNA helicase
MTEDNVIKINELDLEMIAPSTSGDHAGGFKLVVVGKPGCFKAGTRVMRFDGSSVPVECVKEGDLLMGDDSTSRTVLELCRGHEEMYKITPVKGDPIIVNKNHILSLKCTGYNDIKHGAVVNITVADYLKKSKTWKSRFKWYRTGVDFPHHEVKVDP